MPVELFLVDCFNPGKVIDAAGHSGAQVVGRKRPSHLEQLAHECGCEAVQRLWLGEVDGGFAVEDQQVLLELRVLGGQFVKVVPVVLFNHQIKLITHPQA